MICPERLRKSSETFVELKACLDERFLPWLCWHFIAYLTAIWTSLFKLPTILRLLWFLDVKWRWEPSSKFEDVVSSHSGIRNTRIKFNRSSLTFRCRRTTFSKLLTDPNIKPITFTKLCFFIVIFLGTWLNLLPFSWEIQPKVFLRRHLTGYRRLIVQEKQHRKVRNGGNLHSKESQQALLSLVDETTDKITRRIKTRIGGQLPKSLWNPSLL